MKASSFLLSVLVFATMVSALVHADESVDSRIRNLEETVQTLERRVASLEAQLHERSAPAREASARVDWRKLRRGMSAAAVEALLGSPAKIDNYGSFVVWHYGVHADGEVQFETKSDTVTEWHEPE